MVTISLYVPSQLSVKVIFLWFYGHSHFSHIHFSFSGCCKQYWFSVRLFLIVLYFSTSVYPIIVIPPFCIVFTVHAYDASICSIVVSVFLHTFYICFCVFVPVFSWVSTILHFYIFKMLHFPAIVESFPVIWIFSQLPSFISNYLYCCVFCIPFCVLFWILAILLCGGYRCIS